MLWVCFGCAWVVDLVFLTFPLIYSSLNFQPNSFKTHQYIHPTYLNLFLSQAQMPPEISLATDAHKFHKEL